MRRDFNHRELGREAIAYERILAVRPEHGHAWTVGQFDALRLLHPRGINYRYVIFTAHRYPKLTSIRGEECFMWRSTDVHDAYNFVCRRVNQSYRIRSDRNDSQRLAVGRITESVNKKLPLIERTQSSRHRVAKSYNTDQLVLGRINHRNRVRSLIGRVNAIVARDWKIRARPARAS